MAWLWLNTWCPFFHWQNIPFWALVLSLISLLDANYMKELCCAVQRDMEPPSKLHLIKDQGYLHRAVLGRLLVWLQCFERHLQGFPGGPFQEVFLLQWREKPFCFWARSNVFCSVALHPIHSAEVCKAMELLNSCDEFPTWDMWKVTLCMQVWNKSLYQHLWTLWW